MTISGKIDRYMKSHGVTATLAARKLGLKPWAAATWYKKYGPTAKANGKKNGYSTNKNGFKRTYSKSFTALSKVDNTGDVQAVIRRLEEAVAVLKVFS